MKYSKVFVAGGARGVGRAVIDKLVEQGSEVVALVRREDAKAELDAIPGAWMLLRAKDFTLRTMHNQQVVKHHNWCSFAKFRS